MTPSEMKELVERARLIGELQSEGIHIALPLDTDPFAMLAALDPFAGSGATQWVAIQVVITDSTMQLTQWLSHRNEVRVVSGLVVAVTSLASRAGFARTFALTQAELTVVRMVESIERASTKPCNRQPSTPTIATEQALRRYEIGSGQWRKKLRNTLSASPVPGRRSPHDTDEVPHQ